uniref:Uncharacterized protein n=1 Tax=Picea sitchensis TaxID=3332 RepID=D5AB30_PICSI|nr:unknown [Picea sitchensis]
MNSFKSWQSPQLRLIGEEEGQVQHASQGSTRIPMSTHASQNKGAHIPKQGCTHPKAAQAFRTAAYISVRTASEFCCSIGEEEGQVQHASQGSTRISRSTHTSQNKGTHIPRQRRHSVQQRTYPYEQPQRSAAGKSRHCNISERVVLGSSTSGGHRSLDFSSSTVH